MVCTRPVPGTNAVAMAILERGQVEAGDSSELVLADEDLQAVQKAVDLAATTSPRGLVTALTVGPQAVTTPLRRCLALGADSAMRIDLHHAHWDGLVVARVLAEVIDELDADLVLCGTRSRGGMHGLVGAAIAHFMNRPVVSRVVDIGIRSDSAALLVVQKLERGDRWSWTLPLPAVCLVADGLSHPRYLSVRCVARCRDLPITVIDVPEADRLAQEVRAQFGDLVLERITEPRVRVKQASSRPQKAMTAAERLKALRLGGPNSPRENNQPESGTRWLRGDSMSVAREVTEFLASHGFI